MSARRAAMSRGRLTTLARAGARTDLSAEERTALDATRRHELAVLARAELHEALITGTSNEARRGALQVVRSGAQPPRVRAKALAAAVAPGLAARRLKAQEHGSFVTVGDRRLPRT
jgi:hypothetical protein